MTIVGFVLAVGFALLVVVVFLRQPEQWHEMPRRGHNPGEDQAMGAPVLLPLSAGQVAFWRTVMHEHANREKYGCAICRVCDCPRHFDALVQLAMAGQVDWDPIRERTTR